MSDSRNEELITLRSFSAYSASFAIMLSIYLLNINEFDSWALYFVIIGLPLFYSVLGLINYVLAIVLQHLFDDSTFYKRSFYTAISITGILVFILLLIGNSMGSSIFFGVVFFVLFELPRFGIVAHYDVHQTDPKLIRFISRNYTKGLLAYFILSLVTVVVNWNILSPAMIVICILANIFPALFLYLATVRTKARSHAKRLIRILKIQGLVAISILLVVVSIEILNLIQTKW